MTEPTLPPEPPKNATADELEADIAATREQLGETIDALEDKLDVSAQAKRKVDQTKAELADKVNTTKAHLTSKVGAVKTQVTDKVGQTKTQLTGKVGQTKAQVTDKVVQTKAKVTRKKGGPTTDPTDPGFVADTVYPAEARVADRSEGSSQVTFSAKASQTKAAATEQVKNITTRLTNKIAEARTKAAGTDAETTRAQVVDSTAPAGGRDCSTAGFTATGAAGGKASQTKAILAGKTSQFTDGVRQNPVGALAAAVALLASVATVWLGWRAVTAPDPVPRGA